MKSPTFLLLILSLLSLVGCSSFEKRSVKSVAQPEPLRSQEGSRAFADTATDTAPEARPAPDGYWLKSGDQSQVMQQVSLQQADQSQSITAAFDRKIIRNAELTLEVGAPADVQRKISSIAETVGGFVVTSEAKQRQLGDGKQELEVNLVVRIPAIQFNSALEQIRSAGSRVMQEKISGQDVTEEFIDLEARSKTQKALESQFLEIMKQAHKVEDALEVQRQIADVRTEIEKLEGRKRFLENRASLSTITVSLQSPAAIAVSSSGFGRSVREAAIDGIDVASAIVLFLIRMLIVMIPVTLLVILPGWLLARAGFRRTRKLQLSRAMAMAGANPDETGD